MENPGKQTLQLHELVSKTETLKKTNMDPSSRKPRGGGRKQTNSNLGKFVSKLETLENKLWIDQSLFWNSKPGKTNSGPTRVCFGTGNFGKQTLDNPRFVFKLETLENKLWANPGWPFERETFENKLPDKLSTDLG